MIGSGKMRRTSVVSMHRTLWLGNLEGKDFFEAMGIDGRLI
jgi:hypothetical protein